MKKTIFKGLMLSTFLSFSLFSVAQSKSAQSNSLNQTASDFYGVELNEENQSYYNQNGVVRCISDEVNEKYRSQNPNAASKQQFEDWIGPLVEERKQLIASQKAAGTYVAPAPYQIPIIFHVVSGAAGDAADLDAQYVNAQIDQLNIDFAAQDPDVPGSIWSGVAADAQIVFVPAQVDPNGAPLAEPGINRVYGYPGELGQADFDNTIKPATVWDRTRYCNNWTGNLGGGLLGYAQFPDNSTLPGMPGGTGGAANTDGVVNLYRSIGSELLPHPAGGVYGRGRTLTHEIGHWIGLRHIWGDAGCNADDFCADTPNQGGSSSGCPTTADTCTTDSNRDMVENFMDYSHDSCMFLFTADQVARMHVVMENSPGRTELASSTTGNAGPSISFATASATQNEGSDCSFTDVVIDLNIAAAASNNAVANLTATNGTATSGADFELMTSSVSFAAGATATQSMTLRIYNDSYVEGNETFTVGFTVNANGGDATAGNNLLTFTINDDDTAIGATGEVVLFEDGFESYTDFAIANVGGWTLVDNDGDATYDATNNNFPNEGYTGSFIVFNPSAGTPAFNAGWAARTGDKGFYCFNSNGSVSGTPLNDDYAITPQVANVTGGQINFWAKSLTNNYSGGERFQVGVSATNDGTGVTYLTPSPYVIPPLDWTEYNYTIPASFDNQNLYVVVHVVSADEFVFMMDDFSVKTNVSTAIQTSVNTATQAQIQLQGAGTAYTADTASGNAIANVEITDASIYGCTTVAVSREGTSGQSYNGSVAPALVTDKTYTITPATENASGTSTLSFYFSEAELAGWEAATTDSRNNLKVSKVNGSNVETVNVAITPFGSDFKLTAAFTSGVKGTYYFGNIALLSTSNFSFNDFSLFPNPVKNQLNVGFTTSDDVKISLYDIRGRQVKTDAFKVNGSKFNATLNLSSFASGIYVMKINSGGNTMFKKLVVN